MKFRLLVQVFFIVALGVVCVTSVASAQTESGSDSSVAVETAVAPDAVAATDTTAASEETAEPALEGVVEQVPATVPSTFGLWWRTVRERVSIAITRDPVKKAEKELRFADERMQLAKVIAEKSTDPAVQAKAQAMVEKANEYIQRIQDKKDVLAAQQDGDSNRLLKNLAAQQLRSEAVFKVLAKTLPADQADKVDTARQTALEQGKRLLNAINNPNLPEDVRVKLEEVKARVEKHVEEVKQFNEDRKAIEERLKAGDPAAQDDLKQLREHRADERIDARMDVRMDLKDVRKELRPKVMASTTESLGEPGVMMRVRPLLKKEADEEEEGSDEAMMKKPVSPEQVRAEIQAKLKEIKPDDMKVSPAEILKRVQQTKDLSEQRKREVEQRIEEMEQGN